MIARSLPVLPAAMAMSFFLFWLMTGLISVEAQLITTKPPDVVGFVRVALDEKVPRKIRLRPSRPPVPAAPRMPQQTDSGTAGAIPLRGIENSDPFDGAGRLPLDLGPADGDAVPLVRVPPRYPESALVRGIAGRVLVEYDIAANGSVSSARVIAAEPPGVFEEAALSAVRQWRFSPRIENGRPVARRGLRISIPFRREGR